MEPYLFGMADDSLPHHPGGHYPRAQSLNFKNGVAVLRQIPFPSRHLLDERRPRSHTSHHLRSSLLSSPILPSFSPAKVENLNFDAYFTEQVHFDNREMHMIRPVKLTYNILDQTISVVEPETRNSGLAQGRIFWRQRVPKNSKLIGSGYLHWSDFNIGYEFEMFGRVYRLVNCTKETKQFLEENGIGLNAPEPMPRDPYTQRRIEVQAKPPTIVQNPNDKSTYNPLLLPDALTFRAAWLDKIGDFYNRSIKRNFDITLFPKDETLSIKENTGGFQNQLFLKRQRLYKPMKRESGANFHSQSGHSWYRLEDFQVGRWIFVYGRPMLIYEAATETTAKFLTDVYGRVPKRLDITTEILDDGPLPVQLEKPPGLMKFLAQLENGPAFYRDVQFVLCFDLSTRILSIYEKGKNHKWSMGRPFLHNFSAVKIFTLEHYSVCFVGNFASLTQITLPDSFWGVKIHKVIHSKIHDYV